MRYFNVIAPLALLLTSCDGFQTDPLQAGEASMAENNFADARIHLLNALKQDRTNPKINMLLAKTLLKLGDGLGAQTALERIVSNPEYGAEARALLPKAMLYAGNYEAAIDSSADVEGPFAGQIAWSRAAAQFALEQPEQAVETITQGLTAQPDDVDLQLLLAAYHLESEQVPKASVISAALNAQEPENVMVQLLAGNVARHEGREIDAQEIFDAALAKSPKNFTLLQSLGDSYRQTGQTTKAEEAYRKALAITPNFPPLLIKLSELVFRAGRVDEAFKIIQPAQGRVEKAPAGLRIVGLIEEARGNHELALAKLRRYINRVPNDLLAKEALARSYRAVGNTRSAEIVETELGQIQATGGQLGESVRTASQDVRQQLDAAQQAINSTDWAQADAIYNKLLAEGSAENLVVLNNASMVKLRLKDTQGAVRLAKRAYRLAPSNPYVQDSYAWALMSAQSDIKLALDLLTSAYRSLPRNPEIAWHFAKTLSAAGRKDDAREVMEKLKATLPTKDHAEVDQLIAKL